MKKERKRLVLSNDPIIARQQIGEWTRQFWEEHEDLRKSLAEGPKPEGDE